MNKWFKRFLILFAGIIFILLTFFYFNVRDRHPGYYVDLSIMNNSPAELKVGFSAVSITPEIYDRWTDVNGDAKYIPKDGDTFKDGNGNGKFDPIWIAGFSNKRAANGVHDKIWARTMVVDDGQSRIAITSIDAIGFMNDDILDVKELISKEAGIIYTVISSTHTHESPDLLGLWGGSDFKSGVNQEYLADMKRKTAQSIDEAARNLKPAKLKLAINPKDAIVVVKDTRKPYVFDEGLRMMQVLNTETNETMGTLVAWADHPETLWSENLLISSDFPHYVREGIENGVFNKDSIFHEGLGGIAVYFNGAIGGLMTTHPSLEVKDILTG
ncbi:MAG: neutral/alkaline non-lysosomal ceramidase N-terminal domain-containing protein, partial [Cyclobacteriaceae bacterium]|nr:neutral/alkaline non-lysosomal ceramidase N-terminal domain-containing protein [Cyclobacteriaceae bacterium]